MEEIKIYSDPTWEERTYAPRGKIIAHFSNFEKVLDCFLAAEFSSNNKERGILNSVIFDRMTFESKRTAVKSILLKRPVENEFTKTKSNSHPHKKIIEELGTLNAIRKQFAHHPTVQATNEFEYSHVIGLAEFRDSSNFKWFSSQDIENIIHRISVAQFEINKLRKQKI